MPREMTGNAVAGQQIGQWVDNTAGGLWNLVWEPDGYHEFQSTGSTSLYLTSSSAGTRLTLKPAPSNGSQVWQLVPES